MKGGAKRLGQRGWGTEVGCLGRKVHGQGRHDVSWRGGGGRRGAVRGVVGCRLLSLYDDEPQEPPQDDPKKSPKKSRKTVVGSLLKVVEKLPEIH